jgi:hypothetical protein
VLQVDTLQAVDKEYVISVLDRRTLILMEWQAVGLVRQAASHLAKALTR